MDAIVSAFLDMGYEYDDIMESCQDAKTDEEILKKLVKINERKKKFEDLEAGKSLFNQEEQEKAAKLKEDKIKQANEKKMIKITKQKELKVVEDSEISLKSEVVSKSKLLRKLTLIHLVVYLPKSIFEHGLPVSKKKKLRQAKAGLNGELKEIKLKDLDAGDYLKSKRFLDFKQGLIILEKPKEAFKPPAKVEIVEKIPVKEKALIKTFKDLHVVPKTKFRLKYADPGGIVLNLPEESDPVAPEPKTDYYSLLSEFKIVQSTDPSHFSNYVFTERQSLSNEALKRLNREISTLEKSLPCDSSASIFVMYDGEDMGKLRVMVSGPSDTVYSYGLYLFDVIIPGDYPRSPPLIQLCTTGNGKMRFNPNLYNTGKVCLSIINTWPGDPNEKWNPSTSTLLQVFLSIQALVMGNKIIQNEPTYEAYEEDSPENVAYQFEVRYGNLKYAIIENLNNPPKGFEEVVLNHFLILREEVVKFAEDCMEKCRTYIHHPDIKSQNALIHDSFSSSIYKIFQRFYFELSEIIKEKYS